MELASALLPYKNNRSELIAKLKTIFADAGMNFPFKERGKEVYEDICPFTVFGSFNKGITNANRIALLEQFAKQFSIKAAVPTEFDGIPVVMNLSAWFFAYKENRGEHDIDNLWDLLEKAIAYSDEASTDNKNAFIAAYDTVTKQKMIKWNITMGLYWARPYTFINLDSTNRAFITDVDNMPHYFTTIFSDINKGLPDGRNYLFMCEQAKNALNQKEYEYHSSYAFQVLNEDGYKQVATEEFENAAELCTAILVKGVSSQLKRGLGKEYIVQTEELSTLRGKIDISASVKEQTMLRKRLVCNYDEFSVNSYMNRIIRTTMDTLVRSNISKDRKKQLRKLLIYFAEVEPLNRESINWKLQFNKNNQTYQMLISICYLILKGLLQTTSDGSTKLMDFLDEQRMCRLYEKFILEYFKKEHPEVKASASQIPWDTDDGYREMLPVMQSDIMLKQGDRTLVIDAKYYAHTTQKQYDVNTLHSGNLYQIFTYVKNLDTGNTGNVSGMLLYAKTDELVLPNNNYKMGGNAISVKTLDLDCDFAEIRKQLDDIVGSCFETI